MDYTALRSYVLDTVEDDSDEIVDNIDNLIQRAENRILYEVQLPAFQANTDLSLSLHASTLAMPADFLSVYVLAMDAGGADGLVPLIPKDLGFIYEAYPTLATTYGTPRYYAVFNEDTLTIAPAANASYTVKLSYFAKPESIVTATNTWLGDNAETLLSSAAVLEAYLFIKGEADSIQTWATAYQTALDRIKNYGDALTQRDDFRNNQVKRPVSP